MLKRLKPVLHELPASEETPDAPSEPQNDEQGQVQQREPNGAATCQRGEAETSEATGDGLRQPTSAEEVLAEFLQRIAEPTKYIAGFRTRGGLELALERNRSGIALWTEVVPNVEESGFVMTRRYDATTPRNSNLNSKNCPRLKLGREVLTLKLCDTEELIGFINWYQNCRRVEAG